MIRQTDGPSPSLDALEPRSGTSRSGMPLSVNRPPAPDLEPWVGRLVAAHVDALTDHTIRCGMCNDLTYARIVQHGDWTATTLEGTSYYRDEVLLFGPHSRYMPLSCTGPVISVGVGLRPGAYAKLTGEPVAQIVDRIVRADPLGLVETDVAAEYPPDGDPEEWLKTLEDRLRRTIARVQPDPPDPVSTAFEEAGFADPNIAPGEFAESIGISLRKLERITRRDFGLPPKRVLRRARALDLAAQLCGVADDEEEQDLLLRFFDQSHQIREFAAFFGSTPATYRAATHPLMTINVETRQARRLEVLNRIRPEEAERPWFGHARG